MSIRPIDPQNILRHKYDNRKNLKKKISNFFKVDSCSIFYVDSESENKNSISSKIDELWASALSPTQNILS